MDELNGRVAETMKRYPVLTELGAYRFVVEHWGDFERALKKPS